MRAKPHGPKVSKLCLCYLDSRQNARRQQPIGEYHISLSWQSLSYPGTK